MAGANQLGGNCLGDDIGFQDGLDIIGVGDRGGVEGNENIADEETGTVGGTVGFDGKDDEAAGGGHALGQGDWLEAKAEETLGDAPAGEDFVDDGTDGGDGDGHGAGAAERTGGESDEAGRSIDDCATGGAGIEGDIETQELIDRTAAPGTPGSADHAEDTHRGARAIVERAADSEGELACLEGGCISRVEMGGEMGFDSENGEIGTGMASGDCCGDHLVAGKSYGDVVVALDGVIGGDDDAGLPKDSGRSEARPGVDGGDERCGPLDCGCELIGKGGEKIIHGLTPIPGCGGRGARHIAGMARSRPGKAARGPGDG